MLRCLLLFLQFWVIFSSMHLQWPDIIAKPISALSAVLSAGHAPPVTSDCILVASGMQQAESRAIARSIFVVLLPLFVLAVLLASELLCWWGLRWMRHKCWQRTARMTVSFQHLVKCRMHLITLAWIFFFYPQLARTCLSMFVCVPVTDATPDAGTQLFWGGYTNIQCGTGWHQVLRSTIGVLGLALICLGVPIMLMVLLMLRSKDMAHNQRVLLRYGSLYRCYKQADGRTPITGHIACAWESCIMFQTTACVAVTVFQFELGEYYQAVLMNMLLAGSVVALLVARPYRCARLQRLMVGGAICLTLTTYVALVFFTDRADSATGVSGVSAAAKDVLGILVLLGNLACMLWGAYEMMLAFNWERMYDGVCATARWVRGACGLCWGHTARHKLALAGYAQQYY